MSNPNLAETQFKEGENRPREMGKKGGSQKSIAKQFSHRKWCTEKCPMWPCWAQPMSKEQKGMCALKMYPSEFQVSTLRFVMEGRKGFHAELSNKLSEYVMLSRLRKTPLSEDIQFENTGKAIDKIKDVCELVYGKKAIIEADISGSMNNVITIDKLRDSFKKYKAQKGGKSEVLGN